MNSQRKKVRIEIGQLEKALAESRKELELLRVEYEHNMKAHEQIGPMAKEMRHLINSLQVIHQNSHINYTAVILTILNLDYFNQGNFREFREFDLFREKFTNHSFAKVYLREILLLFSILHFVIFEKLS